MSYKRQSYCSMYTYDDSELITINTADEYHAVTGLSASSFCDGATFTASATGSITDTADNGGVLRCTDDTHGLTTGQYITLNGMGDTAHNGVTRVTVIDANTFDADNIPYNSSSDTGSWQRGSSLTIDSGYGGIYTGGFSITATAAVANKDFKFEIYGNTTAYDEFAVEAVFPNTTSNNVGSGGLGLLKAGDVIWLAAENKTDTADITIVHVNVHLVKL